MSFCRIKVNWPPSGGDGYAVITASGDAYARYTGGGPFHGPLIFLGNFWSEGGPTPAKQETWGGLKTRYR